MEEIHYAYWLHNIQGIGAGYTQKLLEYAGAYEDIWNLPATELANPHLNLPISLQKRILESRNSEAVLSSFQSLSASQITFIHNNHPDFPSGLRYIHNAPQAIYYRGKLPNPAKTSVAIVGARNCSEYGRYVARKIGSHLGNSDIQVISGLALGVDGIAQKGALDSGGYSCAVLGCGIDICYPSENQDIYNKLLQNGGIISEYPPNTQPKSSLFPLRNRIISALADIVVVIEAREKSGSLITVDYALEQGKDIYALPGRVTDSCSHGCNRLIKQGAGIILSAEEFLQDINVYAPKLAPVTDEEIYQISLGMLESRNSEEEKIISCLGLDPKSINEIQNDTRLSTGELMSALMKLTMRGEVCQNGSYYFLKTK